MKIYTKTGDKGQTSLVDGSRVNKDDLRLDTYGTADELSSFIGLLIAETYDSADKAFLIGIQKDLFVIGAALATPKLVACEVNTQRIEAEIDNIQQQLPPLHSFILPGGCRCAALAHVCRTICRRLERLLVRLSKSAEIDSNIVSYINRLSDYFFVLARKFNIIYETTENTWQKTCK